jgi:hypothetical protein
MPKWKIQRRCKFQGLSIAIENKKGTTRSGKEPDGTPWSVVMPFDYGYIDKTVGKDGDAYDCFIGPDANAKFAYIVHQSQIQNYDQWDEDKVMLGFSSADAAIRAYKAAYNNVDLFHSMTVMPMAAFKKKVLATKNKKRQDKLHAGGPGSGRHKEIADQIRKLKPGTKTKILAVNYGDPGDDYRQFREGTAIQPTGNFHPPSLKNPIRVPSDNPDDEEDKYKDRKKRKSKKTTEFYKELARRQVDKPTIAETTSFVPLSQG